MVSTLFHRAVSYTHLDVYKRQDLLFKCLDAIDSYVENIKSTSDEGTDDNEVIIRCV